MGKAVFLFSVWLALVSMTIMEAVFVALEIPLVAALSSIIVLAAFKAVLIALYYQHLRHEPKPLGYLALGAIFFLVVLVLASSGEIIGILCGIG